MNKFTESLVHSLLGIIFFATKCNADSIPMEYNALKDIVLNKHTSALNVIEDVSQQFNITIHVVDENNSVLVNFVRETSMYEFYIRFAEDRFSFVRENIITTSFISGSSI